MSDEEIMTAVRDHCVSVLKVQAAKVTLDARLREDLEADSLDLAELHVSLEDEWGRPIPRETFASVRTVGDVIERARDLVGERT